MSQALTDALGSLPSPCHASDSIKKEKTRRYLGFACVVTDMAAYFSSSQRHLNTSPRS